MSVITFWNNGKEQTGKTLSLVAIATNMSIEHNYKILIVSTSYKDETIDNCFWKSDVKLKKNLGIFGPNTSTYMGNGMEGIIPIMKSNKLVPEIITNYTKIVFKDRLEILTSHKGTMKDYQEAVGTYSEIIELADKYYDMVLVDLDSNIGQENVNEILKKSTIIVATINQRLSSIDKYMELKKDNPILQSPKTLLLIGRFDKNSKYNLKNITRYMKEKNKISIIPYNTLFFESAEETTIPDFFLRLRKLKDETDRNYVFIDEVRKCSDNIIYRLQDLQIKK